MRRREFLSTILAGATVAATWQAASAGGIAKETAAAPSSDKGAPVLVSQKGFAANDESPATVNPLNPEWMYIEFGPWNWNMDAHYNCKWALHLTDQIPNADDVAKAIQHPSYDGWWLTLNEPDLANVSPKDAVAIVQQQMQVVLSVDPNAKFCLGMGSQIHAPGTTSPWFPKVWRLLPKSCKSAVKAFHTHYYAQCEPGLAPNDIFSPVPIRKYVKMIRSGSTRMPGTCDGNYGLLKLDWQWKGLCGMTRAVTLYPLVVQDAMNGTVERWAWYSESTSDGYATLCESYSPKQTALGSVFAAMQSGIYPLKQKA